MTSQEVCRKSESIKNLWYHMEFFFISMQVTFIIDIR